MRALLLGLVLCGACGSRVVPPPAAGQCADAGSFGCPTEPALWCELRLLEAKYGACAAATDCTAVRLQNCFDALGSCGPAAVRVADRAAFTSEADAEAAGPCAATTCRSSGSCAFSYAQGRVDCVNGRCVALPDADAGP